MADSTQPKSQALCPRKQAIVSSSPAAASVALQLAQLVGVAESHGFKKGSSAVFADLSFLVCAGYRFRKVGARERMRPYYDPPYTCRVPTFSFKVPLPLLSQGLQPFLYDRRFDRRFLFECFNCTKYTHNVQLICT